MNPNNNARGRIRSNMPSVQSRLAKIHALNSFKEAIRQLYVTGFSANDISELICDIYNQVSQEEIVKVKDNDNG